MPPFESTTPRRTILDETNDCTVIACTSATDKPYQEVHKIAELRGRKRRKGFHSFKILTEMQAQGMLTFTHVSTYDKQKLIGAANTYDIYGRSTLRRRISAAYPTLGQMLPSMRKGRFVLETGNHAFAVVDGKVMDNRQRPSMRYRIRTQYTIQMTESKPETLAQSDISAMWERLNRLEAKL